MLCCAVLWLCHAVLCCLFDPGVSWGDIAGLAEAKLQENVIVALYMPENFHGIQQPVNMRSAHLNTKLSCIVPYGAVMC